MNVIFCIFLIAATILLFSTLCAFALEAARAALPAYEEPPTAYSYQIDRQTDDIERCIAKLTPSSGSRGADASYPSRPRTARTLL